MKKGIVILIITALLLSATNVLAICECCQDTVIVYIDGRKMSFPDQAPYINPDNRTLVPVRFVSEALGAEVEWKSGLQRVDISHEGKGIKLTIGQKQAQVDADVVVLDTQAAITNSRTMVPLRFVSECLGATVEWKGDTKEIFIDSAGYTSDTALIDSDLRISTPPPGDNPHNVNLIAHVFYMYDTPVEPQLADLQKILEKRFGDKAATVMEYIRTKDGTNTHLDMKDWNINGKHVSVYDAIGEVSITIWN